jgi:hypothetical protein
MPEQREEPIITVNGHKLTEAQAMTVRVAIESFAAMLAEDGALGADEHARALTDLYKTRLAQIQIAMYK